MMYGTVETDAERLEHMLRLRDLQDETGGFTAFITWSFQPDHTELGPPPHQRSGGIEYLRTLAIARLVLDNFDNLQASWVTQGGKVGQLSLAFGANDMGSVMIEENVVRAAGAAYCMDEVEIVRNVEDAGFVAKRRNMHYEILGDPFFRAHEVKRMLELSTAREAGDTSVPAELVNYPARSAAGKKTAIGAGLAGLMTFYRAAWGGTHRPRAHPGRDRVGRSRPHHRRRRSAISERRSRYCGLGNVALLPGSSTRTRISSCRGCAIACRRRRSSPTGSRRCLPSRQARSRMSAEQIAPIRDAIASCRRRHRGGRRHQQLAGRGRADAQAGLDGVVFHELLGFKERDGALSTRRARCGAAASAGARVSLAPHAPYRRRSSCSARSGGGQGDPVPDHERAPRRDRRGSGAAPEGDRPVARHARDDRRVA
jgi:hypothetical protein